MKNRGFITLVFLLIMVVSFFIAIEGADFREVENNKTIILKAEEFTPFLSAHNLEKGESKTHSYTIQIPGESFDSMDAIAYRIVIHRLADNAHRIYFNDILIGSRGDNVNGQSNLWNVLSTYSLSPDLIEESNTLRIETVAIYRSGLSTVPIYIVNEDISYQTLARITFFGEHVNTTAIGFIFFAALITFLFYYIASKRDVTYIFITIATILAGIYYSDYLSYESLPIPYLLYKKITMGSLFIGISCYSYAISRYFNKNWLRRLAHFTLIGTLLLLVLPRDMIAFKEYYTYWYAALLMNVFSWIAISMKYSRKKLAAYIYCMSFLTLGIYGGTVAIMDMRGDYFMYNSPVVYIAIFAVLPLMLIYEAINEQHMLLIKERSMREQEFLNSVTDNLTGIWNQRYMSMMFKEHLGPYTLAIIDVDDFKLINDTYGHQAGDFVLMTIAEILIDCLRKSDVICRYGGDEFVVIMKECPQEEGYTILEGIRKKIENHDFDYNEKTFRQTISIGLLEETENRDFDYVFNQADELLYCAKANGKNNIACISEVELKQ